jgi:UDP-3-O-[3-hydroxymyristoyl] N-acetylglucosamine deacetylase
MAVRLCHATLRVAAIAHSPRRSVGARILVRRDSGAGAGVETIVGTKQSTVARRVVCSGIGLHGGDAVEIALCPAEPGTGVVFVVRPRPRARPVEISASAGSVVSSSRATSLTDGNGTTLSTVEHLLATLYALRLDNVRIEVEGSEIPMMDGSALPFLKWVRSAGRVAQSARRVELDVLRPFEIRDGNRWIRIEPHASLSISYAIDFDHPSIGRQTLELAEIEAESFEAEVAAARTFGFQHEIESLREAGLAIGGSFGNAVVLGDAGVLNASGLRCRDEFVRHKVIDLIGDLALLGARVNGHIQVERGGHGLHHKLVYGLLENRDLLAPRADCAEVPVENRGRRAQSLA